jgi:tRNA pseudouridine38-40 synthase
MVRNIVGTLVEVGRGRWGPERMDEILRTRDRGYAGPTALPGGLSLLRVYYDPVRAFGARAAMRPAG